MTEKINDKTLEIEGFLSDLESYASSSFEEYLKDHKTKDACERCFEKIVESLADLAFIFIRENRFPTPKDDVGAFFVLAQKTIISKELAEKMRDAKSMRNIIAHEYGKVDDELVFHAITEELGRDAREFLGRLEVKR